MSNEQDKVLLLLVSGMGDTDVSAVAMGKLGMSREEATQAVLEARQKITLAADYRRDEELGIAILQLKECYTKSAAIQDVKCCLAARRELNKLLRLYDQPATVASGWSSGPNSRESAAESDNT